MSADRTFSGTRDRTLPPITVPVPSTLRWTTRSPMFQVLPSTNAMGGSVNSIAPSGATFLEAGTHQLGVKAFADWTIRIVAGIERPQPLGGGLVGFRGNGGRDLPPFTTSRATKLVWTSSGSFFRLSGDPFTLAIKSQARRGTRQLGAGVHQWYVNTMGAWTVGWKP